MMQSQSSTSKPNSSNADEHPPSGGDKTRHKCIPAFCRMFSSRTFGAFLVTVGLFVMVWIVLQACIENVAKPPLLATKENGAYDPFANAKDLLAIVLPTLSAALGFWFGRDGKAQAQAQARDSAETAQVARQEAEKERKATTALIAAADNSEELLAKAKRLFPGSFSD